MTCRVFQQLLVPWGVASNAAVRDQPARTIQTWHVQNRLPESIHQATAPQQAAPQSSKAALEEGRPPANTS